MSEDGERAGIPRLTRADARPACLEFPGHVGRGGGNAVQKKRDDEVLRLQGEDDAPDVDAPEAMDAAECRWDPWLLALARMEAAEEARVN